MIKKYSKKFMQKNCGCYSIEYMESIFFKGDNTHISSDDIIKSSIPLQDKYWFFLVKSSVEEKEMQKLSIRLAEIVLPIFEKYYPYDKSPSDAIEAAKLFMNGHISIEKLIYKRWAAHRACDISRYACAASAVDAITDSTYAVDDDHNTIGCTYRAYLNAYEAACAAYDTATKNKIKELLIEFVNSQPEIHS